MFYRTLAVEYLSVAWRFVMAFAFDLANLGEDGFADSGGVKIHYVTKGAGPLVVLIHGIPEFWYAWRAPDPGARQAFPGRGHRSARLQPERSTRGGGELHTRQACRRCRCRRQPLRATEGDAHRPRLGRLDQLALRDGPSRQDRSARHPEPAPPRVHRARAGEQSPATKGQRVRAAIAAIATGRPDLDPRRR